MKGLAKIALVLLPVFFSSCIGVSADISIRRDGTALMTLEYRVAHALESLGKQDGNAAWPTVPVGKADFQRTIDRIKGVRLVSFSSKNSGDDVVYTAKIEFSDMEGLAAFLDASGQRAVLSRENGSSALSLTLAVPSDASSGGNAALDPELLALASDALAGYAYVLNFTLPSAPSFAFFNGAGVKLDTPSVGALKIEGNKLGFSASMADLLSVKERLILEIRW
jgi:hypothetical protein